MRVRLSILFCFILLSARHVPFRVGVHFDANEADAAASMAAMTSMSDYSGAPGGIIGFKLAYYQLSC